MRWSALTALLLLLSPQTILAQAVVTNVGIDASAGFVLENGFVVLRASELGSGIDFNTDGDKYDNVLHIYNTRTGELTNTGLESSGQVHVSGNYVVWTVFEINQGGLSLNGDDDAFDFVLHLADMSTGSVTNYGLAVSDPMISGNTIGVVVLERGQRADLNHDGDSSDGVLHMIDIPTGTITNVGVDASARFVLDGNRAVFGTSEVAEGNTDLNGDDDTSDIVLHAWDGATVTNLELSSDSSKFQLEGDLLAFIVDEEFEGNTDLNNDGDIADNVLHVHDFASGTTTNLALAVRKATDFRLNGGLVAMAVSESFQDNEDLNGDFDSSDEVLHLFDGSDGSVTNLEYAIQGFQLESNRIAFGVREDRHFVADLNQDDDTLDLVLHLYDNATGTTRNLETDATFGFKLDDDMLLGFGASEQNQGGYDGNGDGDVDDFTLYVFDLSSGSLTSLAIDPLGGLQTFQVDGEFVSFGVNEYRQGSVDYNSDGDVGDVVLHYFDATTGVSTNLGLDVTMGHQLQDGTIAFLVTEDLQNETDLNGDADARDMVLHVAKLETYTSPDDMIAALTAHLKSLDLRRRIERGRVVLLRLAQRAMDRDKPCLSMKFLRVFQRSVRVRSGHGIPEADAAALIAEAGDIIDVLEEQYPECTQHHHRHHR